MLKKPAPVNEALISNAESIRREHLKHEASVKSLGMLYWLGGVILLLAGLVQLLNLGERGVLAEILGPALILMLVGGLQFWMGFGIHKLKKGVKIPLVLFSVLGLLGFPAGTIINIYILFLVLGKKGQMVFSDEYKEIIRETPHVKYKTSKAMKIILGLIVLGCIGLVVYAFTL